MEKSSMKKSSTATGPMATASPVQPAVPQSAQSAMYRTLWRWHFYAGLFVLPFVITLSMSGVFYLFKPQIERWEERSFHSQTSTVSVAPQQQVAAALTVYEGARLLDYRLPERVGDAALIRLALAPEQGIREVFVAADGAVLGSLVPEQRLMALVKRIHSELLIGGKLGNWLVELAACWAIVLLASGLYLWWPRGRGLAGTLWPRLSAGGRLFWRDLHAVTGIWVAGFALLLLLTGLPWAGVWGSAFQTLRTEMGWIQGAPAWDIGAQGQSEATAHAHHQDAPEADAGGVSYSSAILDLMVSRAAAEQLAFPAIVTVPGGPGRFGQPGELVWTMRSDAQHAPHQQTIRFALDGQQQLSHERFQDRHALDRLVGYGIAWHEGQLFGWVNQLIGVLTALGLLMLALSGFVMWRRRKPAAQLGAPAATAVPAKMRGVTAILLGFALFLPLLALSLLLVWLLERCVLPRLPRLSAWLGLPSRG